MRILSGFYKNRPIKTPKGKKTRPTSGKVRASIFSILQNQIEKAHFLDLFAGSGSMGLEALSRGAESVTFVEKDPEAAKCIRENIKQLDITAPILQEDALIALKRLIKQKQQFDIIYIDPPYSLNIVPFLEKILPLLSSNGIVILEQSKHTKFETSVLKTFDQRQIGDTVLYFFSH